MLVVHEVVGKVAEGIGGEEEIQALRGLILKDASLFGVVVTLGAERLRAGAKGLWGLARACLTFCATSPFLTVAAAEEFAKSSPDQVADTIGRLREPFPALLLIVVSPTPLPPSTLLHVRMIAEHLPPSIPPIFLRLLPHIRGTNKHVQELLEDLGKDSGREVCRPPSLCRIPRGDRRSVRLERENNQRRKRQKKERQSLRIVLLAFLLEHEAFGLSAVKEAIENCREVLDLLAKESFCSIRPAEATRFRFLTELIDLGVLPKTLVRPLPENLEPKHKSELATSAAIRSYFTDCATTQTVPDLLGLSNALHRAQRHNRDLIYCLQDHADFLRPTASPISNTLTSRWKNLIARITAQIHRNQNK